MSDRSTNEVGVAVDNLPEGIPFAAEIRAVLSRAYAEAREGEAELAEEGLPHLRTFLKATPVGLAILELARAVNAGEALAEHDRQVAERAWDEALAATHLEETEHWMGIKFPENPYRAAKEASRG